jgi:hypothetical protein
MNDGTGTDQGMNMNAADAAAIMAEADARARHVLRPDHRATFLVWGVIWFLGDGLTWLAVRGQHPYHGPNPGGYAATVLLTVLVTLAGLGLWLVLVAAVGAYAGPQNVWAVAALTVGPAFLLVAALEQRLQPAYRATAGATT